MNGWLTVSVSGRDFRRTVPLPLSSRAIEAIALRLTMVERWICLNVAGSSTASRSRDRLAQQRFAVGGHHRRVLVVGAEVGDVVDQDQARLAAGAGGEPGQRLAARRCAAGAAPSRSSSAPSAAGVGVAVGDARLQPLHGRGQALGRDRLEQVVDRAALEGVDRVLVVGGDEHDLRARAGLGRGGGDFQAGQARHADVEEGDVRLVLGDRFQRAGAVLALGDDLAARGQASAQLVDQRLAQQRFVFGDDAGAQVALRHGGAPAVERAPGTVIVAATPAGKLATTASAALAAVHQAQAFAHVLQADAGAAGLGR